MRLSVPPQNCDRLVIYCGEDAVMSVKVTREKHEQVYFFHKNEDYLVLNKTT